MTESEAKQPLVVVADKNHYASISEFLENLFANSNFPILRLEDDAKLPNADKIIACIGVPTRNDYQDDINKFLNKFKSTANETALLFRSLDIKATKDAILEWKHHNPTSNINNYISVIDNKDAILEIQNTVGKPFANIVSTTNKAASLHSQNLISSIQGNS